MALSYVRRMENEMQTFETMEDCTIEADEHIVIKCHIVYDDLDLPELCTEIFTLGKYTTIYLSQVTDSEGYLFAFLRPCKNDVSKFKLSSELVAHICSIIVPDSIVALPLAFETKISIFTYMKVQVHHHSKRRIQEASNHSVTKKDLTKYTLNEIIEKLEETGISWNKMTDEEKYGVFYIKRGSKISEVSDKLDFSETDALIDEIF